MFDDVRSRVGDAAVQTLAVGRFAVSAVRRLRNRSPREHAAYALGRFETVRRAYGRLGRIRFGGPGPIAESELFPTLDATRAVAAIAESAVYPGLTLPSALVSELREVAAASELETWISKKRFRPDDVVDGRLRDGTPAIIASVVGGETHPTVQRISEDPRLLGVVSQYLGYRPAGRERRLFWSFVGPWADDERRAAGQTIDYHFDVHSYNFVYVSFYLTDVDESSGAHVMITGSHVDKPLRYMWGSARQTDEAIRRYYRAGTEFVIRGPAGSGFIQDASCYHKALAPIREPRLALQLRYF